MRICAITTSIVTALTAINLTLFLPFPEKPERLEKYAGSEYYSIIRTVDSLATHLEEEPDYKNNFQKWTGNMGRGIKNGFKKLGKGISKLFNFAKKDVMLGGGNAATDSVANGMENGSYEEVTDNQVSGVIEGDLFKRTQNYIFQLRYGHSFAQELDETYNAAATSSTSVMVNK